MLVNQRHLNLLFQLLITKYNFVLQNIIIKLLIISISFVSHILYLKYFIFKRLFMFTIFEVNENIFLLTISQFIFIF